MSIFNKIFGDSNKRFIKGLMPVVEKINALEKDFEKLSDEELKNKTQELRGKNSDEILSEAFAAVREASKRTLGQRHFDVQLLGGIVLHQGKIAEMRTGEGKTLVATLPAYLNAVNKESVHIITVNDYLSRRDAVWMGQIYNALGLSVGCLNHEASYLYDPAHSEKKLDEERDVLGGFKVIHEFLRPCSRQEAYRADITYGTNNEFGFDYLRDNLAYDKNQISQTEHNFAIVDEIDSILIDEARTPLIISGPSEESSDFYLMFSRIAEKFVADSDYKIDEKLKAISVTEQGIEKAEKVLGIGDIYTEKGVKYVHHLETAIRARALFSRDKDYVVKNGEIIIVDEFTGRLMPGRRWSEGLHQAIEAKEGVAVQKETRTFASITFQNYFKMYKKLAGMTGTAVTSAEEFHKVYNLETVVIPTNKPMIRKDRPDLIFQTEKAKFQAVAEKIKEFHEKGQPVLTGTISIEKNEFLSALLKKQGINHKVLNAKNHEEEGEIIAQAGARGNVTIATNMAGRGVDIVLGGNPATQEGAEKVCEAGGLFVIGTERHEARRIDNQLRGRSGRQGDPGETQFFVSLEDDLMRIFGSDRIKNMMEKFGIPENQTIENKIVSNALESAQSKIEGFNFDSRKHLLDYDNVMNHQRKIIYERRRKILLGGDPHRLLKLQVIDMFWMEHLEMMDYLRSSVRLRAYGQRDPLVEYKNEGLRMFRQMEESIKRTTEEMIARAGQNSSPTGDLPQGDNSQFPASTQGGSISNKISNSNYQNIGRNEPCPCGSGKKYKKCCGK